MPKPKGNKQTAIPNKKYTVFNKQNRVLYII